MEDVFLRWWKYLELVGDDECIILSIFNVIKVYSFKSLILCYVIFVLIKKYNN